MSDEPESAPAAEPDPSQFVDEAAPAPIAMAPIKIVGAAHLAAALLRMMLEELKLAQKLWTWHSEAEQQQVIDRLRYGVDAAVNVCVHEIANLGFASLGVSIEGLNVKEDAKLTCTLSKHDPAIQALLARVGGAAVLVLIDPEAYRVGIEKIKAEPDQPQLPLEDDKPSAGGGE
jgi:hypothetical protein